MSGIKKWGHTQVKIEKCAYTWTIGNFSYLRKRTGEEVESPRFGIGPDQWCLRLYPAGINENFADHLSLYVHRKSVGVDQPREGRLILAVLDRRGVKFVEETAPCQYTRNYSSCGFPDFVKRELVLKDKADELLADDTLTLRCEIALIVNIVSVASDDEPKTHTSSSENNATAVLNQQLEKLFFDGTFGDVRLITKRCGRELLAHKCVIASRSPIFGAMFAHDMAESKNNVVEIDDLEHEVLRELLRYMYAARVENVETMSHELLAAADKYEVEGLKELCEEVLCDSMSLDNVCELLVLADRHNVKRLKARATIFAKARVPEVIDTEGFKKLVQNNVVMDIVKAAVS